MSPKRVETPPASATSSSWKARPEDGLMEKAQCTATSKQSGQRCRKPPVPGLRVCGIHGGGTKAARAKAAQKRAQAEASALLGLIWDPEAAPISDPVASLLALAGKLEHAVDTLGAKLETEPDLDGPTALAWVRVLREQRQALEGIERLNLHERQVALSEQTGRLLAFVVRQILNQLELTPAQRALTSTVVPDQLRRVGTMTAAQVNELLS